MRSLLKKILVASGVICAVVSVLFVVRPLETAERTQAEPVQQAVPVVPPDVRYGFQVNDLQVEEHRVKRNQVFADLLANYSVPDGIRRQWTGISRHIFDFRSIATGNKYTTIAEKNCEASLTALVYEPSPAEYIVFHLKDSFYVERCQRPIMVQEKGIAGEIASSLSETIEHLGIAPELTNKFVDIFGWQVDFQRLQRGDKFKLIYQERSVDGSPIGIGRIQAIYFEHMGSPYFAFPFDQGDGVDYFDDDGKSLRKALLKYPIEFTRISSRYDLNRFHPILKEFRAHLGTDFAASEGTPIRSVGDGVVLEAQFKGGNGNYVKIRHNATYSTAYLHMSRIGAGILPGTPVRQGQTIGYVGMTGWATGPHVCYRFWKNGVQVDALRVELPPSLPLRKEYTGKFNDVKEALKQRLQLISFPAESGSGVVAAR